jgi:mRNA interferase RelE/StbE
MNYYFLNAEVNVRAGLFKLRVGNYRVIYSFDVEALLITIHKIGHRRDIYN